jgi:hypothetical protein
VQQKQREADSAFMAMMRAALPRLRSSFTYEAVEVELGGRVEFQAVEEERRRVLVPAFLETLKQREAVEASRVRAALKDFYQKKGADHDTRWEAFRTEVQGEAAFLAVGEERVRARAWTLRAVLLLGVGMPGGWTCLLLAAARAQCNLFSSQRPRWRRVNCGQAQGAC